MNPNIPLIGVKPQLPPTVLNGGAYEDRVFLQFAPVGLLSIEDAEAMIQGLQAAVDRARQHRAAVAAVAAVAMGNGEDR